MEIRNRVNFYVVGVLYIKNIEIKHENRLTIPVWSWVWSRTSREYKPKNNIRKRREFEQSDNS
jgi:hypothetical protein